MLKPIKEEGKGVSLAVFYKGSPASLSTILDAHPQNAPFVVRLAVIPNEPECFIDMDTSNKWTKSKTQAVKRAVEWAFGLPVRRINQQPNRPFTLNFGGIAVNRTVASRIIQMLERKHLETALKRIEE